MSTLCVVARREDYCRLIGLQIRDGDESRRLVARTVTLEAVGEGEYVGPTLLLQMHAAQRLMDDLWDCGLRPTASMGSAEQQAATEKHLEDMRRLVFDGWLAGGSA